MNHNILSAHKVIGTIVGTIVFVVLFKYIAWPSGVAHTDITLAPAWLALMSAIFGPIAGFIVAFIGHSLTDLSSASLDSVWWTWAIADGMFGFFMGLATTRIGIFVGELTSRKLVLFNIWQLTANAVVWLVIAPLGDHWIYGTMLGKAYAQAGMAMLANTLVIAILGTLFIKLYHTWFVK
ncbi:ECF-type riboflavin transporter substrate-binding protein [Weissella confusa]|uniref:ECF-type riboflavin transporter substrate-binding protein n=1 Tax=Weissella confusa TaxID=1583 RepID=UPI0018F20097|nr:ECF-type riboflavin transporter substrate-binding protein [Weissella confusa]MBJ7659036.1 ECF-type riboflavin transporter substrate-binding protein [Weissella confusa]